jgi:hypothetical protein
MCAEKSKRSHKYQIALSFAGEDRPYVEAVAKHLRERGITIFYDRYEAASLWGKNLYDHLTRVYTEEAQFTIIFVSQHYAKSLWTNRERESAQSRALAESTEYILPARFDDTQIPGLLPSIAYVDLRDTSAEQFADLIQAKLGHMSGSAKDVEAFSSSGSKADSPQTGSSPAHPFVLAAKAEFVGTGNVSRAILAAILSCDHAPAGLLDFLLDGVNEPAGRVSIALFAITCIDRFDVGHEAVERCLKDGTLTEEQLLRVAERMCHGTRSAAIDWAHETLTKVIRRDLAYARFIGMHAKDVVTRHYDSAAAYLLIPDRGPTEGNVHSFFKIAMATLRARPFVTRIAEWISAGRFDGRSTIEPTEDPEILYSYLSNLDSVWNGHPLRQLIEVVCRRTCALIMSRDGRQVGLFHLFIMKKKNFEGLHRIDQSIFEGKTNYLSDDEQRFLNLLLYIDDDEGRRLTPEEVSLAQKIGIVPR